MKKSDWLALCVKDRWFVQLTSKFYFEVASPFRTLSLGYFPNRTCAINPIEPHSIWRVRVKINLKKNVLSVVGWGINTAVPVNPDVSPASLHLPSLAIPPGTNPFAGPIAPASRLQTCPDSRCSCIPDGFINAGHKLEENVLSVG